MGSPRRNSDPVTSGSQPAAFEGGRMAEAELRPAAEGDDLADRAHMSSSTFRQHFRALTRVSPLQYQEQLRLQEAAN